MKALIIGGGIGGLSLALALQAQGIAYHLYEQAPAFTEVGAAIGVSEAPLQLLEELGLGAQVRAAGWPVPRVALANPQFQVLRWMLNDFGGICIHRARLVEVLAAHVTPSCTSLNHQFVRYEVLPQGGVRVHFSDGSVAEGDVLLACDGIHSRVRQHLYPQLQLRYSGQTLWRGISSLTLPADFAHTYYELWGHNRRFLVTAMGPDLYNWLAVSVAPEGQRDEPATVQAELHREFAKFGEVAHRLIAASGPVLRTDMKDIDPATRRGLAWHQGPVCLLGDAIHPTTPNLAQGGCQAMEDAFTLARCLGAHPVTVAFARYQQLREDKVNYVVNQSWSLGKISHQSTALADWGVRTLVGRVLPQSFFRRQHQRLLDLRYLEQVSS